MQIKKIEKEECFYFKNGICQIDNLFCYDCQQKDQINERFQLVGVV